MHRIQAYLHNLITLQEASCIDSSEYGIHHLLFTCLVLQNKK